MKRRIRIAIIIIFIAQVISAIPAITGVFTLVFRGSTFLKYSLKAEADILKHKNIVIKYYSSNNGGTNAVNYSEGYFVSDSLDGELNTKLIDHLFISNKFETYLIENDSLLPVWRLPKSNSCLFRSEEEGERYSIRRLFHLFRFVSLMIGPFFILLYINRFLNKKRKQYA